MNNKYIYASVSYEDDDIPHRTYYYMSDIEDLQEVQRVLVDRNGIETIGIVEKKKYLRKIKFHF